jgi:signal transduction histidine kinase/ligand-binding sensor domain-containing protein
MLESISKKPTYTFFLLWLVVFILTAASRSESTTPAINQPQSTLQSSTSPEQFTELLVTVPKISAGQHLRFDRISSEQGLSQNTVFCILQDSRGFLWFCTQDGLNKYDGYSFTVYKHDPEDANSLSDNWVWTIHEDNSGELWIGTLGGGLDRLVPSHALSEVKGEAEGLDKEPEQFIHYPSDPDDPHGLSDNEVLSILEDRAGSLWIGTRGGLDQFDRENETFTHYRTDPNDPDTLSSNAVLSIYEDQSGVLWVGTDGGGLNRFDRENETFTHYTNDSSEPHSLSNNIVWTIYEDQSGVLWIGTEDGLNRYDRENERFIQYRNDPDSLYSLSNNEIRSIYQDRDGALWIGTWGGGLNRFDREDETFAYYQNDPGDPHSLSHNRVLTIFEDREGVLWIGTDAGGVNKLGVGRWNFAHYQNAPDDPNSLSNNNVRGIYGDRSGALWIGTDAGLDRFDHSTGQWRHYQNDPSDPYSLGDNSVVSIHEDQRGNLWISTRNGLDSFDPSTGRFTHYRADPDDPHSLSDNVVTAIYQDLEGTLWIGTFGGGLNKFTPSLALGEVEGEGGGSDRETQRFDHYQADPDNPHSLSNDLILAIYEDRDGTLWIGTWGSGLDRFDRKNEAFTHYNDALNDSRRLSHNVVGAIYEDQDGTLWIGTYGGGLNKYDRMTDTITHYREKDGLPSDFVYGILEDQRANLWLSTNNGLSRFDPQTETFKNFDVSDGLQSNEFNSFSFYKNDNGQMFFGGINGFNAFHPDEIKDNPSIPPVVLTGLTQGGETLDVGGAVGSISEITLKWPGNFFEFEFAALSYAHPEKNQYAYKLEGFEEDWNRPGTRRYGRYTNLPGGTYTLRMIGTNNDGVWNETGTAVRVTVIPPFWVTWWFRGIILLILLGVVYGNYRLRVRNHEARERELESLVEQATTELMQTQDALRQSELAKAITEERNRLARDLHDSVTQSIYSLTLLAEAGQRMIKSGDLQQAEGNQSRLGDIAQQALQEMRLLVYELRPQVLRSEGLIGALEQRLEAVERRAGIDARLVVDEEIELPKELEVELFHIYQEALNNALKHTKASEVVLSLSAVENNLRLEVEDNGEGFDEEIARAKGGMGLASMGERVEKIGGKLTIQSTPGAGTTVRVVAPINQPKDSQVDAQVSSDQPEVS